MKERLKMKSSWNYEAATKGSSPKLAVHTINKKIEKKTNK